MTAKHTPGLSDYICEGNSTEAEDRLADAASDLLAALKLVEWSAPGGRCPRCGFRVLGGHAEDCDVGKAIARAEGASTPQAGGAE